ncbi:hypothetical protein J3459_006160 [Metarhizium acridum]|uniref:uncharacterized protein n=1 Tax=Metarhizium acridum TaxID=92637 RepID=UPI001C6BAC8F|nr:hypothetical protein J3458_005593 [Metarhizium acridum]KAG8427964.1 hypothetical protein J3459_006160 [Metarhizium acridum]
MQTMQDGSVTEKTPAKPGGPTLDGPDLTTATDWLPFGLVGGKSGPRSRSRINVQCAQSTHRCICIQRQGRDFDSNRGIPMVGLDRRQNVARVWKFGRGDIELPWFPRVSPSPHA